MIGIVIALAILVLAGLAVGFGWTADTRQPGRRWYPTGPDLK
jgi:hypothetical protein